MQKHSAKQGLCLPGSWRLANINESMARHILIGFVGPLVQNWALPEGEPIDEFLHTLEDRFSHSEVWPQPCEYLYVSIVRGRSVGEYPDADPDTDAGPEKLAPLPTNEKTEGYMNLHYTSTTLAVRCQISQLTLITFREWTWTALFELLLAKSTNMARP